MGDESPFLPGGGGYCVFTQVTFVLCCIPFIELKLFSVRCTQKLGWGKYLFTALYL